MQVKLLRVLDGVPYYRLGGVKKVRADVRVVAATNQDLEEAVAEGRFRSDLYHRLSQFVLRVPPLRERVEDIAPLARHILAQHDQNLRFTARAIRAGVACLAGQYPRAAQRGDQGGGDGAADGDRRGGSADAPPQAGDHAGFRRPSVRISRRRRSATRR